MTDDRIREIIKESIAREVAMTSLTQFLENLDKTPDFDEKLQMCNDRFTLIGSGLSRKVYQIDDALVLKLQRDCGAMNQYSQNYVEWNALRENKDLSIVPRAYWRSRPYDWIIVENVLPCKWYDFYKLTGVFFSDRETVKKRSIGGRTDPSRDVRILKKKIEDYAKSGQRPPVDLVKALNFFQDHQSGRELYRKYGYGDKVVTDKICIKDFIDFYEGNIDEDFLEYEDVEEAANELVQNNQWFKELAEFITREDARDLHIGNFGLAKRNGNPYIVILDSGLNSTNW